MRRLETRLEGPILLEPVVHGDQRGFFQETYRRNVLAELGIRGEWVQDNTRARTEASRGAHFQPGMAKLLRCPYGAILDVLVDIRPASPAFGHCEAFELNDETHLSCTRRMASRTASACCRTWRT